MVIFVCLLFAGAMPIMIPILCASLALMFLISKYLFIYCSQVSRLTDRLLADKSPTFLFIAISGYVVNSIWAFGCEYIFKPEIALFQDRGIDAGSNGQNPMISIMVFLRRLTNFWPLFLIYTLGIIMIAFGRYLLNLIFRVIAARSSTE